MTLSQVRQPDHNDGATRPVAAVMIYDRKVGRRSAAWRFLPESQMRPIFVVVGNVLAEQAFQMAFVDGNEVIQEVTATAAHPALRDTILPGTFEGSPDRTHL